MRVDAKVHPFERPGAEEYHVAGLAEYDFVTCAKSRGIDGGETGPALDLSHMRCPSLLTGGVLEPPPSLCVLARGQGIARAVGAFIGDDARMAS